ncbi:unnamed protein product [Thlaspi arvense]|uniref:PB1 domain-containing protein n=1 Tax=Thlaspi arvense TaxID=13288 RepID=A0AAU9RLE6_THLAR|nr:unnamed protein product [Thlaspi arvense]
MEPPPPPAAATPLTAAATAAAITAVNPAATHLNYPDSVDSSPRSRNNDSWEEPMMPAATGGGGKLRLMCSYGGHIMLRQHDKSLCYAGGDTRIVVADRHSTLADLSHRLSKTLLNGRSFTLKYQLPNEDLDSLISVTTDEDLENMIEEYDRLTTAAATNAQKSSRIRLYLFPSKPDSASSIGSLLENSAKSRTAAMVGNANSSVKDVQAQLESFGNVKGLGNNSIKQGAQDVHSVPDSPMVDTTSSFGSTSSSPSLANLPPIRVRMEDQKPPPPPPAGGIEEQFSQMSVGGGGAVPKQDDGGFLVLSSPPVLTSVAAPPAAAVAVAVPGVGLTSAGLPTEYGNRVISDDDRSEHGVPLGYRKPPQVQPQTQLAPPQSQPKTTGGVDLASLIHDSSTTNPLSRQRPMIYQDPVGQNPSSNNRVAINPVEPKLSDPSSRVQMQQVQDSSYLLQPQFDQQLNPQQQQQQFIQAGAHYIHHHPTGAVPIQSYFPMYPPQQQPLHPHHQLDQQYPVYYVSARQAQAYNLPVQQQNYAEPTTCAPSSQPQTPPLRNVAVSKPEMVAGMYRTAATAAPTLVQVPPSQQQYVGYSQVHHPQSVAPSSVATTNYAYADPAHSQVYYTQPLPPQLAAQYQTMTSAPAAVLPEGSTDSLKQQIRTSQP